jgi:molybdopterin-guanine dinucleotide biosynthesis protein A
MPFLHPGALRLLVDRARTAEPSPDAVAVRMDDDRNPPLVAYFSVRCLPAVERVLAGGDRAVRALLSSVATAWVPGEEIARFRDPAAMFFNVNTPDDLRRAEQIARELDERA